MSAKCPLSSSGPNVIHHQVEHYTSWSSLPFQLKLVNCTLIKIEIRSLAAIKWVSVGSSYTLALVFLIGTITISRHMSWYSQYTIEQQFLQHWDLVMHMYQWSRLSLVQDYGLSSIQFQAIDNISWIGQSATNFSEIKKYKTNFWRKKIHWTCRPFYSGSNVFTHAEGPYQRTLQILVFTVTSVETIFLSANKDLVTDPLNSLAPGRIQRNFWKLIFQLILVIDGWSISCKIVLKWMPMDLTDGKSTVVYVMAWCRQATSHYLSQCWPSALSPYDVIRPQQVNSWWSHGDMNIYQQWLR